ncbi:MAG: dienelactone hydrolase family protein [Myxococcales bacterium]|nr:dienelactone hydrolase family protein [Myxococcales bacterium]
MIIETCEIDLATDTGPMRVTLYEPAGEGRYPGLIFYSEIFQQTDPIRRVASLLAGHGFTVAVPEIFHELNPIGTVLAYDDAGKDKGNADKSAKTLEAHDHDTNVLVDCLRGRAGCTGKVGAMGICIGGHLAFRAALNDAILAASCFYATDLHSDTLACKAGNGTLERCAEIGGELQLVWGRQDPHIPTEGRAKIYQALSAAEVDFTWHEFNAQHAFIRDEGPRYDPAAALAALELAIGFFKRTLTID